MKIILIFIALLLNCLIILPANAEGSRELVANGGYRPYLQFADITRVGIKLQANIKVYVNIGEQINLGSSVPLSANGNADIVYKSPFGGQDGSCDVLENGFGLIDTLAKEQAGPLPYINGYTPCTFTTTETGVYEIEFRAPKFIKKFVPFAGSIAAEKFPIDDAQGQGIAAWDITVLKTPDDITTEQKGRIYTNYLPLNVGRLNRGINSVTYFLTNDGYLYRSDLNGMEPYGFIFFANNKGIKSSDDEPLNKSVHKKSIQNGSYNIHNPDQPDTESNITHKMFFNFPSIDLPTDQLVDTPNGKTWLRSTPKELPIIDNFKFTGDEGSNGYAGTVPLKGSFSFNIDSKLRYFLTIDLNNNGVFGDDVDMMLLGETVVGANVMDWNGRDGQGNPAPPKEATYNAKFNFMLGNIHFPFWDVENDPNGFILERIDCTKSCDVIYYNHSDISNPNPPELVSALGGASSSNSKHAFDNNFGNNQVLDIWTFPNAAKQIEVETKFQLKQADISVSKTHTTDVKPLNGGPVTYIITVRNDGPSDASGIGVKDDLPATVTDPTPLWVCEVSDSVKPAPAIQNSCSASNGSGAIDITVDLQNGASATFEVVGTITAEVGDTVTNSVSVTRPEDITNPQGDIASVSHSFIVAPPDNEPPVAVDKSTSTDNSTPVQVPTLEASDSDGTIASYMLYDLPTTKGSLYLGEPESGTLITEGQILTPADINNIYFMPAVSTIGEVIFHYTATDDKGDASNQATVTITVTAPPANEPPVADDKTVASTPNDTTVKIPDLSANDTDGTVESFTINTLPPNSQGVIYLGDPDNGGTPIFAGQLLSPSEVTNIYFKPDSNFTGEVQFDYTTTDNNGSESEPATITIPVTDSNQPPVAEDKEAPSVPNNVTEQLPALEATDSDGTVESYQIKTLPLESEGILYLEDPVKGGKPIAVNETLTPEQVKSLFFQPNASFSGSSSFTYIATDNNDAVSNVATVTIPVTSVPNNPPIANDNSDTTDPNVPVTIDILGNDSDPDDNLDLSTVAITTQPTNGTIVINPDGSVTYTPNNGFNTGTDSFTYRVCDTGIPPLCDTATITITIPTQEPPVAADKTADTTMNNVTVQLPALSATDTDGTVTAYNIATLPLQGILYLGDPDAGGTLITEFQRLTVNQIGNLYFIPNNKFIGDASFTYTATDNSDSVSSPALVTIPVTAPVNTIPIANDDTSTTDIATPVIIEVLDNDIDPEGGLDIESITIITPPPNGTVTANNDGTVTYKPDDDFTKGIDTFTYEVCDTGIPTQCDTAEVRVIVPILDDFPPTAEKIISPAIPNNMTTKLPSLAATDDSSVASYNIDSLPPANQGILYLGDPDNGGIPVTAGQELTPEQISQLYFQPNENFVGNASFGYTATDDNGNVSSPALVTIPVIDALENKNVIANDDNGYTDPEVPVIIDVIGNDIDPEGNLDIEHLITITSQPSKGTVVVNSGGTVTYTPQPGFTFGIDEFDYLICDLDFPQTCDTATVTVLVPTLEDPPPTTSNQTAEPTTNDVTTKLPSLIANDNDTVVSYTIKTLPEQGTLYLGDPALGGTPIQAGQKLTPEQAAQLFFQPEPGFIGNVGFTFTATDNNGGESNSSLMRIPVTAPSNSPPTVNNLDVSTKPDIPISITVLKNDSDPNDNLNPSSLTIVTQPSNGRLEVNLDTGEVEYTPNTGFEGTDSFSYQVCDTEKLCDTATVTITVSDEIAEPTTEVKLIITISGQGKVEGQDLSCNNNNDPCQQPYATDTNVTLTPTPDIGWLFDGWRGHCDADGNVTMDNFKSCKAVFVEDDVPQFSLDLARNGSGSITSQPTGIDCNDDCSEDYAQGTEVDLVANPEPGFAFTHWSGDCSGTNPTVTVLIDKAKSCQANFALDGDGDGVATDIEEGAPNNGDGNDDGIPDWKQNNVVSLLMPDGKYVTIVEKNGCTINGVKLSEPGLTADDNSLVPFPFDLDMSCTDADLEIFYHDADDVDLHRQYADGKWQYLPVTLGSQTVGDKTVTTASFRLSDGKVGDNSDIDGYINHTSGRAFAQERVQWANPSYTIDEFGNVATVAVQRLGTCEGQITVDYIARDNTAQSPDYTTKQGTLTWEADDCRNKSIGIPITNDTTPESDEIIDLVLSNAGGGASIVAPETITLTIIDDDSTTDSCHSFPTCQVCCPTCQVNTAFNVKSLSITLKVGESTEMTLADGQAELLIKEIPNNSFVSLDAWRPLNAGAAELELTGVNVGDSKMVISDSANPLQTITIYIKVIEDPTSPIISVGKSKFRIKAMHTTVKVGQKLDLTVAGGEGELTISEIPDRNIVLLENWITLGDSGSAKFSLTGIKVGQSKIVISDHSIPPEKTSIDLTVVARDIDYNQGKPDDPNNDFEGNALIDAANQYKIDNGLLDGTDKTGSGLLIGKIGELTIDDDCKYGLEISVQGNLTASHTCFLDKLNTNVRLANHSRLTYTDAKTVAISSTVNIAPQHVGQVADVLLVGTYNNISYDISYNRNEQDWQVWDGRLSSLPTAQYYPELTEQIEVFIYEDELDFIPGEFAIFVGYRLRNGTIIYNGLEPIHFFIGNSGSVDLQQDIVRDPTQIWNDVASTSIFSSSISNQNNRTGNGLTFAYRDTVTVSGFITVEPRYVGQPADILIAAGYHGHYMEQAYARNGAAWQFWDHSLTNLLPIQHYQRLPEYLEVPIYIGDLTLKSGYYQIFIGYRLEDGVIVFNGFEPSNFMLANGIGINVAGQKIVTTTRFINWGYQDEKVHNPFYSNINTPVGIATIIAPETKHIGQTVEIMMVAVHGDTDVNTQLETPTWGTWNADDVYITNSIPNIQLEKDMPEIKLFEGLFERGDYTVYIGYKLANGDIIYNGGESLYLRIN